MNRTTTKITLLCLSAAAMLASTLAGAEVTANAALTSNYVWRGVTQTDDGAALQAGVDYAHDSGLYAGAWGSNVEEGLEYDLYAGFANQVGDLGYDLGYLTYNYTDEDFWPETASEIKFGLNYGVATVNHYLGDNGLDADNEYTYTELNLDFEVGEGASLALHYGVTDPDVAGADNVADYSLGVGKEFSGVVVTLSVADNDDDANEEDPLFFVTVKKDFEF